MAGPNNPLRRVMPPCLVCAGTGHPSRGKHRCQVGMVRSPLKPYKSCVRTTRGTSCVASAKTSYKKGHRAGSAQCTGVRGPKFVGLMVLRWDTYHIQIWGPSAPRSCEIEVWPACLLLVACCLLPHSSFRFLSAANSSPAQDPNQAKQPGEPNP